MLRLLLLVVLLAGVAGMGSAQTNSATVTGADRLVVRRGPGKQFPPFASLTEGSKVEVEEIQGEWARIVTGNGQRGYVHSNFLSISGDTGTAAAGTVDEPGGAARTGPATESAPGRAGTDRVRALEADLKTAAERKKALETDLKTATERAKTLEGELKAATERTKALEDETAALTERSKTLEADVHTAREEIAELKKPPLSAAAAQAGTPAPQREGDELRGELVRLTAAVEALQGHLGAGAATGSGASHDRPVDGARDDGLVSSVSIVLGLLGIVVGWFLGGTFGRKQDRSRRGRIRF
jgi:uncharacterized protein YgiM (DUF1202 family)